MVSRTRADRTKQAAKVVSQSAVSKPTTKKVAKGEVSKDVVVPAHQGAPAGAIEVKRTSRGASRPLTATTAALEGTKVGRSPRLGAFLTTASDVERILESGDLSSIQPPVPRALWPYARQLSETLKKEGPLGSHGPLGNKGALGNHAWNPAFWMRLMGDWTKLSAALTKAGGPGSKHGSLGEGGPLSKTAYERLLPNLGPLANQLQAGGLLAVLGPLGPLGALGALGFLGQVGGHGFAQDEDGQFVNGEGEVKRKTSVEYEGGKRDYQLTEMYGEDFAADMKGNDTSWMIRGGLPAGDPEDTFTFTAEPGQIVTLTVVPESRKDIFTVELLDADGRSIATSDSDDYVNWIQFQAKDDSPLKVRVRRKDGEDDSPNFISSYIDALLFPLVATGEAMKPWLRATGHGVDDMKPNAYRLFSVGSPDTLSERLVAGAHQQ